MLLLLMMVMMVMMAVYCVGADDGEEYMLITSNMDEPGAVETLALICEPMFEPYINKDISVKGDVLGSIIWNVEIVH